MGRARAKAARAESWTGATMRALVTGGNRGIGFEIARGLIYAGMDVVIGARGPAAGEAAAADLGCGWTALDLMDRAQIEAVGVDFDVLVNNAGLLEDVGLLDAGDNWDRSMEVMVTAPYLLMRRIVPGMGPEGRVVNVSSGWGSFSEGLGGGGAYGVAKAALNALTVRAAAQAPRGVKINAMCPGWVRTRMGGPAATTSPEDAADTAIWLATLDANGPTGGFYRRRPIGW